MKESKIGTSGENGAYQTDSLGVEEGKMKAVPDEVLVLLKDFKLKDIEQSLILYHIKTNGNNKSKAARSLGLSERTVRYKINGKPRKPVEKRLQLL